MTRHRFWIFWRVLGGLVLGTLTLAGCASLAIDVTLGEIQVVPSSFSFEGGVCQVTATLTGDASQVLLEGEVVDPEGEVTPFLVNVDVTGRVMGQATVPPNLTSVPRIYRIRIIARPYPLADPLAETATSVTVQPADGAPPNPPTIP